MGGDSIDEYYALTQDEKNRARNRRSQLRFRQRLQSQTASCEARIQELKEQIAGAYRHQADVQRTRVDLSNRNAAAATNLAKLARQTQIACAAGPPRPERPAPVSAASSDGSHAFVEQTRAAFTALGTRDKPPILAPNAALVRPHRPARLHAVATQRRLRSMAEFRHCVGIWYEDLVAVSRRRDSSSHSVLALLQEVQWEEAARLGGCSPEEVCWFMQLGKEVAPGLQLSFSSALCTPECVASMAVHYLTLKLEAALLAAVLEREAGARVQDESPSEHSMHSTRRPGALAEISCLSGAGPPPVGSSDTEDGAPRKAPRAAVDAAASVSAASAGDTARSNEDTAPPVHLRCGVNQTVAAGVAVPALLRGLVRDFCGRLPLQVIASQLESWLHMIEVPMRERARAAQRAPPAPPLENPDSAGASASGAAGESVSSRGNAGAGPAQGTPGGAEAHGGSSEAEFLSSVKRFAGAILPLVCRTARGLADVQVLRELEEEARRTPAPAAGALSHPKSASERVGITMGTHAVCWNAMMREAGTIVRGIAADRVFPRMKDHDVHTMCVLVYRELRRLSPNIELLANHWTRWQQASRLLDSEFVLAMHDMRSIPAHLGVPTEVIAAISHAAGGPAPLAAASDTSEPSNEQASSAAPTWGIMRMHAPRRRSWGRPLDSAFTACEVEGGFAGSAEWGAGLATEVAPPLGAVAAGAAAAAEALQRLVAVHNAAAQLRTYTASAQLEPGLVFDAPQLARMLSTHVRFGSVPVDVMGVCRLAAMQQKRHAMSAPLPFLAVADDHPTHAVAP